MSARAGLGGHGTGDRDRAFVVGTESRIGAGAGGRETACFPGTERPVVPSEGLAVETGSRRVWTDSTEISLTFQEYELLEYLITHPGKVFSRIQRMTFLWAGPSLATPRTVDVHIHRLRRKLGRHGVGLVTVRRVGSCYRSPAARPREAEASAGSA